MNISKGKSLAEFTEQRIRAMGCIYWTAFGDKAFIFEILEALEKKKEQTQDEFIDDLKMLEQLWKEKLDSSTRY
jgi:hypothetical protein